MLQSKEMHIYMIKTKVVTRTIYFGGFIIWSKSVGELTF